MNSEQKGTEGKSKTKSRNILNSVICKWCYVNMYNLTPGLFCDYERKRREDTYTAQTPVKLTVCMPYKFFLGL